MSRSGRKIAAAAAFAAVAAVAAPAVFPAVFPAVIPEAAQAVRAADPVPPMPPLPARIPFADELAGRKLLYAAQDAYHAGPALHFRATWTLRTVPARADREATGTQTADAEPRTRRLALVTETADAGGKQTRRIVRDDLNLVTTLLQSPAGSAGPGGGDGPTRQFVRLPVLPGSDLTDTLRQAGVSPGTRAGTLLLSPALTLSGRAWRGKPQKINGIAASEVWEAPPAEIKSEAEGGASLRLVPRRRWLLHPKTSRLLRFEEWTAVEPLNDAARAGMPVTTLYRREDYDNTPRKSGPPPAALYSQALPAEYRETPLPPALPPLLPLPPRQGFPPSPPKRIRTPGGS